MDLITSIILIVVFIVIQQVAILYAINKIDNLARERDIYKDRLADKIECDRLKDTDVTPTSYELHSSEDYSTFVQTLQEQKKDNEALQKKLKAYKNESIRLRNFVGELDKENKELRLIIDSYQKERFNYEEEKVMAKDLSENDVVELMMLNKKNK